MKGNGKVVELVEVREERSEVEDGNLIVWCEDMVEVGEGMELEERVWRIGGMGMDGKRGWMEEEGKVWKKVGVGRERRLMMREEREEGENE